RRRPRGCSRPPRPRRRRRTAARTGRAARRRGPRPARRPDHRAGCGGRAAARGRRAAGMTATYTRLVSRRAVLWIAFAVVHAVIATLGYLLPSDPMGDVGNVYDPWSRAALAGHIVGVHEQWVYPQLALVPMVVAQLISWAGGYFVAWAVVATAMNAIGFAVLIGRARSRGRVVAAWYWLGFLLLLGPIALYRVDAVTVPLAIMGGLW